MNRYKTATNSNFYQSSSTAPEYGHISNKPQNSDSNNTTHNMTNTTGNFQNAGGYHK